MFHSQQVFCEAMQCSLQIKAPQLSWLWIIAFFINVTNCLSFLDLEKNENKEISSLWCIWLRPRNTALTSSITDFIGIRPYYSFSLSHPEDIVSILCFEAENPLIIHCPFTSHVWENWQPQQWKTKLLPPRERACQLANTPRARAIGHSSGKHEHKYTYTPNSL